MKRSRLIAPVFALLLIAMLPRLAYGFSSQIMAPVGTSEISSNYVDTGYANDPVYIFCSPNANGNPVSGTLWIVGGDVSCLYNWQMYDSNPASSSYQTFVPIPGVGLQTGDSSAINNLASGFYKVIMISYPGQPTQNVQVHRAHVFVNETLIGLDPILTGCTEFYITGGVANAVADYTVYDPAGGGQQTLVNVVNATWDCSPISWDPAWGSQDFALNPQPFISPLPSVNTYFKLTISDLLYDSTGVLVPEYNPCVYELEYLFSNLFIDASIISYPGTLCMDAPPVQLVPMNTGGHFTSALSGNFPPGAITSNGLFFPSLGQAGDNLIIHTTPGVCGDQKSVVISLVDGPELSNLHEVCLNDSTYKVTLKIQGGNPGAYSILNCDSSIATGSLVGTTWISSPIPSETAWCFIFSDDNDCFPSTIDGLHNCNCMSEAGFMPSSTISICGSDPVTVVSLPDILGNPTYTLDGDDCFQYILHSSQGSIPGAIYETSNDGTVHFQAGMVKGQVYFISQVVGTNIGTSANPQVDLSDTCLAVSLGTPVVWYDTPDVNAGPDFILCDSVFTLMAELSSITNYGILNLFAYPGTNYPLISDFFDPNAEITFYDHGFYTFTWTEFATQGGNCSAIDTIKITYLEAPQVDVGTDLEKCGNAVTLSHAPVNSYWEPLCTANLTTTLSTTTATIDLNGQLENTCTFIYYKYNTINTPACTGSDTLDVTFYAQPQANAGSNDSVSVLNYILNAQLSQTGMMGHWSVDPSQQANLFFSDASNPHAMVWVPVFGIFNFTWTEFNPRDTSCFSADMVSIRFYNPISIAENEGRLGDVWLYENMPNPFKSETEIRYYLPENGDIEVSVLNSLGQTVRILDKGFKFEGTHSILFDGSDLQAGVYFFRLGSNEKQITKKMVLVE